MTPITQNFCWEEFTRSATADRKDIINAVTTWEVRDNILDLVRTILQPMRGAYGRPITVTSGYRCPALNRAVGGSATSAHLKGLAADLIPTGSAGKKERQEFIRWAIGWLKASGIPFDQVIDEHDRCGNYWLHIGLRNLKGEQRGIVRLDFEKK